MIDHPAGTGGFFGRRKGKRLRAEQAGRMESIVPALKVPAEGPVDLPALFGGSVAGFRLEIGFGGGEHLASQAIASPRTGFIGCEAFVNGVAKMAAQIEAHDLTNVRLDDGDASRLLPRLPDAMFERVDLLYPDPWPKRRQRKRRFVSPERLAEIARIIRPGGTFRFASDIDDYIAWTLMIAAREPRLRWQAERADDWRRPWDGWTRTRYEAKAVREGRVPTYLIFERI